MKEIIKKEKRRGMKIKRMLSVVLTLAMVFSFIPMNSMTVYADNS